ncbi:MAG: SH3 domain-containing protein [Deltaproteobacteria bacterium]|nr:SH3 domain-containing protein [Deltaproteobacteria bacterium]MBL7205331.1 SH3 domain-containing protein [Desulfobacteraceae bacterium]
MDKNVFNFHRIVLLIVLLISMLAMYGCAMVRATTIKPAEIDLSRYKKIAVLDFDGTQGKKIASYIESEISKVRIDQKPYFNLISRSHLDKVLKEQALHMTGAINPKTASKVGRILGAEAVITGSVNAYDSEDQVVGYNINRTVFVSFTAQFINVQTGEIITSIREEKKKTATKNVSGGGKSTGSLLGDLAVIAVQAAIEIGFGPKEQMLDQAAQIVAANFVKKITPRVETAMVFLEVRDEETGMLGVRQTPEQKALNDMIKAGCDYGKAGLWEKAISIWEDALKKKPTCAAIHFNLGVAYEMKGNLTKSREMYEKAANLKPDPKYIKAVAKIEQLITEKEKFERCAKKGGRKPIFKSPPPPAVQEGELSVKVSHANVRQEPSTKSRVVATLTQGTIIEKLEKSGNWIKIKLANGTIGWIYKTLVGPVY